MMPVARPRASAWVAFSLLFAFWLGASAPAQAARKTLTVQEEYELGERYLKRGYYTKALDQFSRIRNFHRDDPYAVKAELAIADVYYKKNDWAQARLAYEDFMRMHPRHADLDYVVYRVGLSLYKESPKLPGRDQATTRQAVNSWSGFDSRFPESKYKPEVTEKLVELRERLAKKELLIARFYAQRQAWRGVEGRAAGIVLEFPGSPYEAESLALLAQAHAWQGEAAEATDALTKLQALDPHLARRAQEQVAKAASDAWLRAHP